MDSLTLLQMLMGQQNEQQAELCLKIDKLKKLIEQIENQIEIGKHLEENVERFFNKNLRKTIILKLNSFRPMKKSQNENVSILSFPDFSINTNEIYIQNENEVKNYKRRKKDEINHWNEVLSFYKDNLEELETKKIDSLKFLNSLEIELDMYLYNDFTPNLKLIKEFTGKTTSQINSSVRKFDYESEVLRDAEIIRRRTETNAQNSQKSIKSLIAVEVAKNYKNKYAPTKKTSYNHYVRSIYYQLSDNNTFAFLPDKEWPLKSFLASAQKKKQSAD